LSQFECHVRNGVVQVKGGHDRTESEGGSS